MTAQDATALLPLQARFQQHMLGAADATELIAGSPARRALGLAIYANAYRQRLVEALADAYAKTRLRLGETAFDNAALAYIAAHPPTTRSLRWYGGGFAAHLHEALPQSLDVAELAQLDWALRNAFDGPDSAVLAATDLAGVPPEAWATLQLRLVPTAELLRFAHNTVAVWQALDDDEVTSPPRTERAAPPVTWLVWRKDLQPHFRSLHPVEAALLRAMQAGATFAQACEQAQSAGEADDVNRIGFCLRQWFDDGLLSGVVLRSAVSASVRPNAFVRRLNAPCD